jgi:F420-non-reducing hydrogenase iron-sulfur subunit
MDTAGIHIYYCRNASQGGEFPPALTRLEVRGDVRLEAVPCSGKVDPRYLLKAFESGASAVCVLACPSGHCKMMQGNLRAGRRIGAVRQLIAEAGLDPNALQVFLPGGTEVGALEAAADSVAEFVNGSHQPAQKVAVQ